MLQSKPELRELLNLLSCIAHRYFIIGVLLNVPIQGLLPLPKFYQDNLITVLQYWMDNGNDRDSPVTWEFIITVLSSDAIDNYELAKKVKEHVLQKRTTITD